MELELWFWRLLSVVMVSHFLIRPTLLALADWLERNRP